MILSSAEIDSIVSRALSRSSKRSTQSLRRMLAGIDGVEPDRRRGALEQLCALGVTYGWRELERTIPTDLLKRTSARAKASLRRYLQGTLAQMTRPCFQLEWTSFDLATKALRLSPPDAPLTKETFLGNQPSHRIFGLFKKFPALAELWSVAVTQWRDHVTEILTRAVRDGPAIARTFFENERGPRITDVRLGLSDRHLGGRSVALVELEHRRVIYKPRSGTSEIAWSSVVRLMNKHGFRPRLKEPLILRRRGYHWMEHIAPASCDSVAGVQRFYKQIGGLIAAAFLLNAVDCHRDNLIAAGEHPVLVDVDTLWHVSPLTKTQSATELLYRTGFFPNSNPASLQSRSSALGRSTTGTHRARIGGRPVSANDYADYIVSGFAVGWGCLLGTPQRRAAFLRRVYRIRSQERRWIYLATEKYAAILRASIQPAALTSSTARAETIRNLCGRTSAFSDTIEAEIAALERLDIPYFTRRTNEAMPAPAASPSAEILKALRKALELTR